MVENYNDYKIKTAILNDLSIYLGYNDFEDFTVKNIINSSKIKINIDGKEMVKGINNFSDIIINITNSPIFNFPDFLTKNSNFGLLGVFLISGVFFNIGDFFSVEKEEIRIQKVESVIIEKENKLKTQLTKFIYFPSQGSEILEISNTLTQKEFMYWNGEYYVEFFYDEVVESSESIALNKEKKLLSEIIRPDALTKKRSLVKVWCDKSKNHVRFFTHYGKYQRKGKTFKEVMSQVLEKYAKK